MPAAAAALNISVKTLERRIKAGRLETRRTDEGRVEVKVDVPDSDGHVTDALMQQGERQLQLAGGAITAWQQLAEKGESETARLRRHVGRAWSATAIVVALAVLGGWWAMRQQGRAALATEQAQHAARSVDDMRSLFEAANARATQAESRAALALTAERERATELRQAVARSHDLELQLSQFESQMALAAAGQGGGEPEPGPMAAADSITENSAETLEE